LRALAGRSQFVREPRQLILIFREYRIIDVVIEDGPPGLRDECANRPVRVGFVQFAQVSREVVTPLEEQGEQAFLQGARLEADQGTLAEERVQVSSSTTS